MLHAQLSFSSDVWEYIALFGGRLSLYLLLVPNFAVKHVASIRIQTQMRRCIQRFAIGTMVTLQNRNTRRIITGKIVHYDHTTHLLSIANTAARKHIYFVHKVEDSTYKIQ